MLANGILTTPKLAKIDGMETFKGEAFHTSRWNYNIDLTGKRVGIIGTGATAVQVVPEIAKVVKELYVFQRTPSSIDVRDQRETTDEERETWPQEPDNWAVETARAAGADLRWPCGACRAMTTSLLAKLKSSRSRAATTPKSRQRS